MKKKLLIGLSVVLLCGAVFASTIATATRSNLFSAKASDTYSFQTGLTTEEEIADGGFTRYTGDNNPIKFRFSGAFAYDGYSVAKLQGGAGQACFYNETAITGLKSINFRAGTNMDLKVYYGSTLDAVEGYIPLTSADFTGPNNSVTVEFKGSNVKYFSIVHNPSAWNITYLRNVTITYTCGETYRGEVLESGVNISKGLSDLPLTSKFVFDLKITDDTNTHVNVMFGDGWSNFYGYYAIYANGATGENYAGVKVIKLSDGYLRCTFDFSQLNKVNGSAESITKINLFYLRGGWSNANGFIDIQPTINAYEVLSPTKSIINVNTSRVVELNEKFMLDWRFDEGQTNKEYVAFSDNDWSNFYGYYGIWVGSSTGTITNGNNCPGLSVEVVGVSHFLITFNISELDVVTGDIASIDNVSLFIFTGNQTGVFTIYSV